MCSMADCVPFDHALASSIYESTMCVGGEERDVVLGAEARSGKRELPCWTFRNFWKDVHPPVRAPLL